jgi:hypothetical protein
MKTSWYDGIKELMKERKKIVQDAVRTRLRLFLNVQNPLHGTTICGKAARRFFENPMILTEITRVEEGFEPSFWIHIKSVI